MFCKSSVKDSKDNIKEKRMNKCVIAQDQIVIESKGCQFAVHRDVQTVQDVKFLKKDKKISIDEINKAVEQFQFVCMYGMLQLQNTPVLIFVLDSKEVAKVNNNTIYQATQFKIVTINRTDYEPFLSALEYSFQLFKLYYCLHYDISKRIQAHFDSDAYKFQQYFSNYIHTLSHDSFPEQLITVFITGFAKTEYFQLRDRLIQFTLISRGNYNRLGRRWLRRGLDLNCNTANQYQTEMIVQVVSDGSHQVYSYVQQRGSIPLFWQQYPCFEVKASLNISQDVVKNKNYMSYYLGSLVERYGSAVLLNLINKTGREGEIGRVFQECLHSINHQNCKFVWFDYQGQYEQKGRKAFEQLIDQLGIDLTKNCFAVSAHNRSPTFKVSSTQKRVVRTNCMDCLDRTNYIQTLICRSVCLQLQSIIFKDQGDDCYFFQSAEFELKLKSLWKENGIAISRQYSGTATMKNDFMEKGVRTFRGMLDDFCIGLHRFYLGHFADYYNQNCLDLHFGKINFAEDKASFNGVLWKKIFKLFAFSGIALLPAFFSDKIADHFQYKMQRCAITIGSSFIGFLLGVLFCKMGGRAVVEQPISRMYEII